MKGDPTIFQLDIDVLNKFCATSIRKLKKQQASLWTNPRKPRRDPEDGRPHVPGHLPPYEAVARLVLAARINHFDETLCYLKNQLMGA